MKEVHMKINTLNLISSEMLNSLYDNNYFEIAEVDNDIQRPDDGFGLLVNDATTQNDIDNYLLLAGESKHSQESPLNINVQFETVNPRKAKQILDFLNSFQILQVPPYLKDYFSQLQYYLNQE